jgi:hypothetical protein
MFMLTICVLQPSLSASWLFQRSMSVAMGQVHRSPPATIMVNDGTTACTNSTEGGSSSSSSNETSSHEGKQAGSAHGISSEHNVTVQMLPAWRQLPASHVNDILAANFSVMGVLGDRVLRPFLQVM